MFFLIWIIYSVLSCKLATSFCTFLIFIHPGKNGKSLQRLCKTFKMLNINLNLFAGNVFNIDHPCKLFTPQYLRLMNSMTYCSSFTFLYHYEISISVKRCNFNLVFFEAACYANPGAVRKWPGSSSSIWRKLFQKYSNTSASNNVLLWTCKS